MDIASKKGDLEEKDIPQPDHTLRAQEVVSDWNAYGFKGRLIWSLIYAYKGRLALQWSVTLVRCALGVGPFWAMLQLISLLEERGGGGWPTHLLWGLVISLGVFSLAEQVGPDLAQLNKREFELMGFISGSTAGSITTLLP